MLGYFRHDPQIRVKATARALGKTSLCVIGLDPAEPLRSCLVERDEGKLTASDCAVYSNSRATDGKKNGVGRITRCCRRRWRAAPGVRRERREIMPINRRPTARRSKTRCRRCTPPVAGACDYQDVKVVKTTAVLKPEVYCGGILIDNKAMVTFEPGQYIIKDGVLRNAQQ